MSGSGADTAKKAAAKLPAPEVPFVDVSEIPEELAKLRSYLLTFKTRPLVYRAAQLRALRKMITDNEDRICQALHADLRKNAMECKNVEINSVIKDLDYHLDRLHVWTEAESVSTPLLLQPGSCYVVNDPLGVCLILGAFNFPFQLTLAPLVPAIAAGNCVVVKPSEVTAHSNALLAELIPAYLNTEQVQVWSGGVPETTAMLAQRWDHIFFTGSAAVGRVVAMAAAKHLTPVTLELGGKSPSIVDADADLALASRRILWSKFVLNCGQVCLATDYVMVHASVRDQFVRCCIDCLAQFFGADPQRSPDYGRLVHGRAWDRLKSLMDGAEVLHGGQSDKADLYIAPTLVNATFDSAVMKEEIFGPILPIVTFGDIHDAIAHVNAGEKPLALYVFSKSDTTHRKLSQMTSSGGFCINDTFLHAGNLELPFGGVGESGMGAYHGTHSFKTFSHQKACFSASTWVDPGIRYPPYTSTKHWWLGKLQ